MAKPRSFMPFITGLVFGSLLVLGYFQWFAPRPAPYLNPATFRGLDANLFAQTSAEYRACCLQTYSFAGERVLAKLATRGVSGKPPAVVLDLDETVIDNGAYQARQIRTGRPFESKLWDEWEEHDGDHVRLVPGAKEFLAKLASAKVRVVYVSNRGEKFREKTHHFLKRLEIDVPDDQLYLLSSETTTDKTARRAAVADKFDVLLLVGDNLRDFDEVFKFKTETGTEGRKAAVDERRERFGTDWIILPNPLYGEWTKGFTNAPTDVEFLK